MLHGLGEVNPTHAYYNGSRSSKDNEDPSWSTSFKTRRTQKTSSALEVLWKTLFVLYLYLIGTLSGRIRGDIGITTFRNALRAHYLPYISGKRGGHDQISNKDAIILHCLANGVKVDYVRIIWEDIIHKLNKKTKENVVSYPRFISLLLEYMMPKYDNEELTIHPTQIFSVLNWALKPNQHKGPPFTDYIKAICNIDVRVDSQALKSSSQTEKVPQGKKLGAKKNSVQFCQGKKPKPPSPSTPMVGEMHKEAQQAAGGPTSLGATSKEGAHPQLSSGTNLSVHVDETISAGDGLKTAHTDSGTNEESRADEISKKIKLEDLSDLMKDTRSAFFTLDSPHNEPIIILDESEEEETKKDEETHTTSHDVAELKNIQWELPAEFLDLPSQVSSVQEKLKTLDSLPSLLNKVTDTLNRFATVVENESRATSINVPSAGQATALPAEGKKNTNLATRDVEPTNLHNELVDLLGIDIVTHYYNKKLLYDKYCDKMLKRRKSSKIINCEVLT
ncbi:hypothetical protein Tco_1200221 [Tanacetum coccineum]